MNDFLYFSPTKVFFGKDKELLTGKTCQSFGVKKVLVHYGSKSAKSSGLLGRVFASLSAAGVEYVELGGAQPNPRLSKVYEGIELAKAENVDLVLAVGGGSAIDSAKAIAYGVKYDGDVWDYYKIDPVAPTDALPIGVVLTMAAAGSELSASSVITNDEGNVKRGSNSEYARPKFAIMNPELTFSLPMFQTQSGVVDIMMHTIERYFSKETNTRLTDGIAETLIRRTMEIGEQLLSQPDNYDARCDLMWASSLSHNGLTGAGRTGDWATHKIEHELSGMYDVAHGAGLSALWASWARYVLDGNEERFANFAVNVMGVNNNFYDVRTTALLGIKRCEEYFTRIGMPTNIKELVGREASDAEIAEMAKKATGSDRVQLGNMKLLKEKDIIEIFKTANIA